jgi:hypothetical protein
MKIHPLGMELFHVNRQTDGQTDRRMDRQTDMMKVIVGFHNFVYTPRNGHFMILQTLLLETLAFHFWVVLEDARLFLLPVIMMFTEGWDFPVMLLKCLSKFLFCLVPPPLVKYL